MKRDFDSIISNLKVCLNDYKYYVNFDKVYQKASHFTKELDCLNSLIGSKNIEKDFCDLITKNKKVLKVIPLLLALRESNIHILDKTLINYNFENKVMSNEEYCHFMRESGLFDLLENKKISNLNDYVVGLEVGMDTNGRKNRSGTQMEKLVESYLKEANLDYHAQVSKKDIQRLYNFKLDDFISNENFKANKIFDFAFKKDGELYLVETNFYGSGGSKLNETARSFKSLAKDIDPLPNINFIWITDGVGWKTARNNLKEAYENMKNLCTIYDLENNFFNF